MKLFVFTVFDTVSGVYDRPFCARSEGEARRSFADIASDAEHPIGKHPEHFQLFSVGIWDDNVGEFTSTGTECVMKAHEAVSAVRNGINKEKLAVLENDSFKEVAKRGEM